MRKIPLARLVSPHPLLQHFILDPPHSFHLWNARIGNAIHVAIEKRGFVSRRQIAIVRHALVKIMRDQIENILFEIRARTADSMNLVLPDHLGERQPKLSRAHRAGDGHKHLAARRQMSVVSFCSIYKGSSIEVTIVVLDKRCNCGHFAFPHSRSLR